MHLSTLFATLLLWLALVRQSSSSRARPLQNRHAVVLDHSRAMTPHQQQRSNPYQRGGARWTSSLYDVGNALGGQDVPGMPGRRTDLVVKLRGAYLR